jgi:hypothetical protein
MTDEEKSRAAQVILDMPLFNFLMDELEAQAIDACLNANPTDNETRAAYASEARAIRNLRSKLNFLAEEAKAPGVRARV